MCISVNLYIDATYKLKKIQMITKIVKPIYAEDGSVTCLKTIMKFLGIPVYRRFRFPLKNDHPIEYHWF